MKSSVILSLIGSIRTLTSRRPSRAALVLLIAVSAAAFIQPTAHAQMTTYAVTGDFNDGTTFGGTFNFDPTTDAFGSYSITTMTGSATLGPPGVIPGTTYTASNSTASYEGGNAFDFETDEFAPGESDGLGWNDVGGQPLPTAGNPTTIGSTPGVSGIEVVNSGTEARVITSGTLAVAPAPEASSLISFAMLFILGVPLFLFVKKQASSNSSQLA